MKIHCCLHTYLLGKIPLCLSFLLDSTSHLLPDMLLNQTLPHTHMLLSLTLNVKPGQDRAGKLAQTVLISCNVFTYTSSSVEIKFNNITFDAVDQPARTTKYINRATIFIIIVLIQNAMSFALISGQINWSKAIYIIVRMCNADHFELINK